MIADVRSRPSEVNLICVGIALAALGSADAEASTLQVGAGKPYATIAAAAAAAVDGDVVEIDAETFNEAVVWPQNDLTIRGVGGRPTVDMTGTAISNGKGIFVTTGANVVIENIELVGASVADQNGAGIRWEGGGSLTVRRCVFRSNENGILGGNPGGQHPENTALIELNEFVDNGRGDVGYTHSVYFGEVDSVTFQGNWSHAMWPDGGDVGHLFKSRARRNFVLYNRLTSETSISSYEVNIPQGGEAIVLGNLIQQRVGGQRLMISFGDGDGTQSTGSTLYVVNNTIVSESTGDATFIRTSQADAQVLVANNLIVGPGVLAQGGVVTMTNNVRSDAPGLIDPASFDYHLLISSPAVDAGTTVSGPAGFSLVPEFQYVHPTQLEPREAVAALDVGAYEYGNMPVVPGDPDAGEDDPGSTAEPAGCGCATRGGGEVPAGILSMVVFVVLRRRLPPRG